MSQVQDRLITYCTNIHPGEAWEEHFAQIRTHVPTVKRSVAPGHPFPLGLRLSRRAAAEMDDAAADRFGQWCAEAGCFVPTINGFPYGTFHAAPVKDRVYLPDWRSRERADYTIRLAELLARWLPAGMTGSISTVPVGFRRHMASAEFAAVRRNIMEAALHLAWLREHRGREIVLALEPEPGCVMETTADAVALFERLDIPSPLRDQVGLCVDCCHLAVEFEEPADALTCLERAGIRIAKVQVSAALRLTAFDRALLEPFDDPVYLHQTVIRQPNGVISRYDDLPDALAAATDRERAGEWRVHFHVPVFLEAVGGCATTRLFLEEFLPMVDHGILLEVETYTWGILPPEPEADGVSDSIVREIRWVKGVLP